MATPATPSHRAAAAVAFMRQARAAGHKPPRRALPRQQPPDAIAGEYARAMRGLVEGAVREAYAPLLARLPAMLEDARRSRGDADDLVVRLVAKLRCIPFFDRTDDKTRDEIAAAKAKMGQQVDEVAIARAARKAGREADELNHRQLGAQVKAAVGIDLVGNVPPAILEGFVAENVALIQDITPALASRIEAAIHRALTTGQLHDDLAATINEHMVFAADRAELIAVDQVGKIYGQVNARRQQDLGVTEFVWRTVGDERVRGNPGGLYPKAKPSHWDRDGKTFKYADPPKGRNGEPELPGVPIRCRCSAEPKLDHLLDDLPDPGEGWQVPTAPAPRPQPDLRALTRAAEEAQHRAAAQAARAQREAQVAAERAAWDLARAEKLASQRRG